MPRWLKIHDTFTTPYHPQIRALTKCLVFLFSDENLCCRYSWEAHWWGASNEYPHIVSIGKNINIFDWKKNNNNALYLELWKFTLTKTIYQLHHDPNPATLHPRHHLCPPPNLYLVKPGPGFLIISHKQYLAWFESIPDCKPGSVVMTSPSPTSSQWVGTSAVGIVKMSGSAC